MSDENLIVFRLYIVGDAPNSVRAVANLNAICQQHLPGRFRIEIVDILTDPSRAQDENILLTPTLLKVSPKPSSRIVGNLSETDLVLQSLALPPVESNRH